MPKSKHRRNGAKRAVWAPPTTAKQELAQVPKVAPKPESLDNPLHPENMKKRNRPFLPHAELLKHLKATLAIPHIPLVPEPEHNRVLIIAAGGPSLEQELPKLQELLTHDDHDLIAVNGTCDWLRERGITPKFHLIVDPQEKHSKYVQNPSHDIQYVISSQCHPLTSAALADYNPVVFHVNNGYEYPYLKAKCERFTLMKCGSTAGLACMTVFWIKGYRRYRIFGMDGSIAASGKSHLYDNTVKAIHQITVHDRVFNMDQWMVVQMYDFQNLFKTITYDDGRPLDVKMYGDGSLPYTWKVVKNNKYYAWDQLFITEKTAFDASKAMPKRRPFSETD